MADCKHRSIYQVNQCTVDACTDVTQLPHSSTRWQKSTAPQGTQSITLSSLSLIFNMSHNPKQRGKGDPRKESLSICPLAPGKVPAWQIEGGSDLSTWSKSMSGDFWGHEYLCRQLAAVSTAAEQKNYGDKCESGDLAQEHKPESGGHVIFLRWYDNISRLHVFALFLSVWGATIHRPLSLRWWQTLW